MFDINTILAQALADAVNARITEVLQQHANIVGALAERIAELEQYKAACDVVLVSHSERLVAYANNPAIGVDTTLAARIDKLEGLEFRIATLEDGKGMSEARVEALIETAIEQHCVDYDHDSYDQVVSTVEDADLDDIVAKDDVEDIVRSAVNDAEITIRIR